MAEQKVSKLEIELLLVFYNFSSQNGNVDIPRAKKWVFDKMGIIIPNTPFRLEQKHVDILMDSGVIPDTRFLAQYSALPQKPKRRKRSVKKTDL